MASSQRAAHSQWIEGRAKGGWRWPSQPSSRSPTIARGFGQAVVSFVAAVGLGMTAWVIADDPEGRDRRVKGDAGYTPNANTAFAAGSLVGATVGAYAIGRADGSGGSLLATALGVSLPSIALFAGRHEPYLPPLGVVFVLPLQAIGGTVAYRLSLP